MFVGDAVKEDPAVLCALADGLGVPCFSFWKATNPHAAEVFQEIARRTNGAFARFDCGAADQLRDLLRPPRRMRWAARKRFRRAAMPAPSRCSSS